ncbi:hypothetical protein TIFTF001_016145 [Ficus carica]|uniref:Receptor-like serine/threonine-protein kinase n=1 Tax=Ficus carica TaxID=3494 RepID=A0AA88D8I0_FICCA|nr:hypothetical protein TIFTF001_016145 [Ficus carica]
MAYLRLPPLLAFILLFAGSEAQQRQSNISLGSSLTPHDQNSSWLSNSGLFAFGFYKQGDGFSVGIFMAGIPQKTVVWTANRDSPPVTSNATLQFTGEGRLVLRSTTGDEQYIGDRDQPASSASMLDSGNLILYSSSGRIIWESFSNPTETLLPTQRLRAGNQLVSSASESDHSSGRFRLKMQNDGNLVQYPVRTPSYAYYESGTVGGGDNMSLVFDADIQLYLLNSNGVNIKNITNGEYPTKDRTYLMRIDVDGIFRLYSYNRRQSNSTWSIEWSSSNDKCDPKGICGINAFCVNNDQEADCTCLPGFDFVEKGNWSSGCESTSVAYSCANKSNSVAYDIEVLSNTIWANNAYSVLQVEAKEGCIQACSDDCNCEAAFYKDGECRKLKLPLLYGRRTLEVSDITLIKVYTTTPLVETTVPKDSDERYRKDILIIGIVLISFGSIMLVISVVVFRKRNFHAYKEINKKSCRCQDVELLGDGVIMPFTYEELEKMTDGFKEEIGRGSFGTVYKGTILNSQKEVAVKKLGKVLEEGEREFQNEMKAIGRTHHKNLVRLLGYCYEGSNRLLIYEYMSNGSLADMLFNPENKPCWEERLGITCGIASGILYLHEECATQIIHCDIKPQNILIDEYRHAKISDFGLAKLLKPDQTKTNTGIRGTRGYVAPEWHRKLPITTKADVYSFGIVMLEIICCRRNLSWTLPEEEAVLEEWVYDCFERGELLKLVGNEEIDKRQLEEMVKVALWCIQDEPSRRPLMKKVLLMLEGTVEIPIPPNPVFL